MTLDINTVHSIVKTIELLEEEVFNNEDDCQIQCCIDELEELLSQFKN